MPDQATLRVLIVDDEEGYRDYLSRSIARDGYDVATAASGGEAIDLGVRYRPDVLVADWMLKNSIHGLHVAQVLQAVNPPLRTVLITGFATHDLRAEADKAQVFEFIEKPFTLTDIQTAVHGALEAPGSDAGRVNPAVVEITAGSDLSYVNQAARRLFVDAGAGDSITRLDQLFDADGQARLDESATKWVTVASTTSPDTVWHARTRTWSDEQRRLLVLLTAEQTHLKRHPLMSMLMGYAPPAPWRRWPLEGRALILDPEELVRRVVVAGLEQAKCICHAAENTEVALRILERDPQISVVITDHELPGSDLQDFVEQVGKQRPDLVLVGSSGTYRRDEFAMLGIGRFLLKPWRVDDLINVLTGHIGNCVDCGLPLPLRRPQPDDQASSWLCSGCGSRYFAVLDDSFPDEIQNNVRAAN